MGRSTFMYPIQLDMVWDSLVKVRQRNGRVLHFNYLSIMAYMLFREKSSSVRSI
jgi:hypothetical protein